MKTTGIMGKINFKIFLWKMRREIRRELERAERAAR